MEPCYRAQHNQSDIPLKCWLVAEWTSRQHSVQAIPKVTGRLHTQNALRIEVRDFFPIEIADWQLVQKMSRGRVRFERPVDGKEDVVRPRPSSVHTNQARTSCRSL